MLDYFLLYLIIYKGYKILEQKDRQSLNNRIEDISRELIYEKGSKITRRRKLQYYKKLPENTKKVARRSTWQNDHKLEKHGGEWTLEESLILFEADLIKKLKEDPKFLDPLIGYNLGCFCNLNQPCHADILLKYLIRREKVLKV